MYRYLHYIYIAENFNLLFFLILVVFFLIFLILPITLCNVIASLMLTVDRHPISDRLTDTTGLAIQHPQRLVVFPEDSFDRARVTVVVRGVHLKAERKTRFK